MPINSHMTKGDNSPFDVSRRQVVAGLSAAAGAAALPGCVVPPAPQISTADFVAASAKLAGIPLDASYLELGQRLWTLLSLDGDHKLRRMTELVLTTPEAELPEKLKQAGLDDTARAVLSVWYEGSISLTRAQLSDPAVIRIVGDLRATEGSGPVTAVITYDNALTWQSCTFTKPAATCGGPFGYWFNLPS